ncbi:MAG: hypothetical protein LW822_02280 [Phycisphaeraceae bacterium]|nr:hypothetical protein [Phycisphaeraceae bacterium]
MNFYDENARDVAGGCCRGGGTWIEPERWVQEAAAAAATTTAAATAGCDP